MLKIFTIKLENKLDSFNDEPLTNFLGDKQLIKWESRFFERENDYYWTIIVQYKMPPPAAAAVPGKAATKKDESYAEILSENDWPVFNRLREWRNEAGKKEGIPPYIIFTNAQMAKIAVTRPASLNALQGLEGVGNKKREKYGPDILKIIASCQTPAKNKN